MQKHATKYYTREEYLAMEDAAEYRSEYYKGEFFAMAGGSINHNRIVGNLFTKLNLALVNSKCEAFMTDVKVWIEQKDLFTYPDVIVVCGKPQFYKGRDDTITNPIIIIEVLSDSTKNYDRIEKFEFYRTLASFEEYILIDQYRVHVEHFYLESKGKWIYTDNNNLNDVLRFNKIELQVSLKDIYNRVEFKKEEKNESIRPSL